jgi:hypothetical protein
MLLTKLTNLIWPAPANATDGDRVREVRFFYEDTFDDEACIEFFRHLAHAAREASREDGAVAQRGG